MLILNLCDYSNAYVPVKMTTHLLAAANENDKAQKNVLFRSCISTFDSTLIDIQKILI